MNSSFMAKTLRALVLIIAVSAVSELFAMSQLKSLSGDRVQIENGDDPNGFGGVDGIRHPSSPIPDGPPVTGRAGARLGQNPGVRPQP